MRLGAVAVALDQVVEQTDMGADMAIEVHGHETGQLDEAGIDRPHETGMREGYAIDHAVLEPLDGMFLQPGRSARSG